MQPNVPEPPDNIEELTVRNFADAGVVVYASVWNAGGEEIPVRVNRVYRDSYGYLRADVVALSGYPFLRWQDDDWEMSDAIAINFYLLLDLRDADGNPVEVEEIPF